MRIFARISCRRRERDRPALICFGPLCVVLIERRRRARPAVGGWATTAFGCLSDRALCWGRCPALVFVVWLGTSGVHGTDFEVAMNTMGRGIEGLDRDGWSGEGKDMQRSWLNRKDRSGACWCLSGLQLSQGHWKVISSNEQNYQGRPSPL